MYFPSSSSTHSGSIWTVTTAPAKWSLVSFSSCEANLVGFFYLDLFGEAAVDVDVAFAFSSVSHNSLNPHVLPDVL